MRDVCGFVRQRGRMTTATRPRLYACARCGKQSAADQMLFSTHTHLRYCTNISKCSKRAKRKGR